jgi:hypothetical protein
MGAVIFVLLIMVVAALVLVADDEAGQTGGDFGLAVGDCFNEPDPDGVVNCNDAHEGEVYVIAEFDDGPGEAFPGDTRLKTRAAQTCFARFEGYVGQKFLDSALDFEPIVPPEANWDDGLRAFMCAVVDPARDPLEGSARGSGE